MTVGQASLNSVQDDFDREVEALLSNLVLLVQELRPRVPRLADQLERSSEALTKEIADYGRPGREPLCSIKHQLELASRQDIASPTLQALLNLAHVFQENRFAGLTFRGGH